MSTIRSPVPHLDDVLTQINSSYHGCVLELLKLHSCEGLSSEDLVAFKREFGPSVFVCRVQGCDKSIFGFESDARLRDHAALHQGKLRCSVSSCMMNDVGFTSAKALRDHKRLRHPETLPPRIPRTISDPPEHDNSSPKKDLDSAKKAEATPRPPDMEYQPPRKEPDGSKYSEIVATPLDITNAQKNNPKAFQRLVDVPASMWKKMPKAQVTPLDIMNARKANPKVASLTDDQLRDFIIQIKQRQMASEMQKEMAMRQAAAEIQGEMSTAPPKEMDKV